MSSDDSMVIAILGITLWIVYNANNTENCSSTWIPADITGLEKQLHHNLYGQHLVIRTVVNHLRGHFHGPHNKALVLSLHGTPGTGKNFVSRYIAEALYYKGVDSSFVHLMSATKDFPHESYIRQYKDTLRQRIKTAVKTCPHSLFIIDEMDKLLPGLIDIIKPFIDFYDHIDGVDYRNATFLFLSNTGGAKIAEAVVEKHNLGIERATTTLKEMEGVITRAAYNDNKGLWHSSLVENNLITAFVPFLPLERKHVKKCIIAGLFRKGYYKHEYQIDNDKVEEIANELQYFPKSTKAFSSTGCKRVMEKIDYVML